ncbi:TetR family transcriptional regulator [Streptomyces sp. NPDC007872]|uniref:TetR family transcriptional regulator n=1 Tax=Streptomyces sp. NPDC007872 TaxID=3364782 RepID=UPI0036A43C39
MQERSRHTREQVLDAAATEFARHGYTETTMNAVAIRIGMTKGALYGHFASKECIAMALVEQCVSAWSACLHPSRRAPGTPAAETLQELTWALALKMRRDARTRAAIRLIADCPTASGAVAPALAAIHRRLSDLVRQGQEEGAITAAHSPESLTRLFLTYTWGVSRAPSALGDVRSVVQEADWETLLGLLRRPRPVAGGQPR